MKSPAQIGPDLSTAVDDVQKRFGLTLDDVPTNPTGTMSVVLSRQIVLTPEQKANRDRRSCAKRSPSTSSSTRPARRTDAAALRSHSMSIPNCGLLGRVLAARLSMADDRRPRLRARPRPKRAASRGGEHLGFCALAAQKIVRRTRRSRSSTTCSRRAATRATSTSTACRRCATSATIPVFTPYPATGYGFDDDTQDDARANYTWGDVHHPAMSRDQRRLRRPLAVRQRDERPHRPHRSARLQDQADPRTGAELYRATTGRSFMTPNTEYS